MRRLFSLLLTVLIVAFCLCGCSNYNIDLKEVIETQSETKKEESAQKETLSKTEAPTQAETENNTPIYYKDDDIINLYVVRYNESNPDYSISSDELEKYYHHGREHDDQVKFNRDDFEIIISGGYKAEVYVGYIPSSSHTNDEYGTMFVRFAKAYNPELSNEELEGYWKKVLDNSSSIIDFEDFECKKSSTPNIEYFKLSGKLK
jgi:hypothetical protein